MCVWSQFANSAPIISYILKNTICEWMCQILVTQLITLYVCVCLLSVCISVPLGVFSVSVSLLRALELWAIPSRRVSRVCGFVRVEPLQVSLGHMTILSRKIPLMALSSLHPSLSSFTMLNDMIIFWDSPNQKAVRSCHLPENEIALMFIQTHHSAVNDSDNSEYLPVDDVQPGGWMCFVWENIK